MKKLSEEELKKLEERTEALNASIKRFEMLEKNGADTKQEMLKGLDIIGEIINDSSTTDPDLAADLQLGAGAKMVRIK